MKKKELYMYTNISKGLKGGHQLAVISLQGVDKGLL